MRDTIFHLSNLSFSESLFPVLSRSAEMEVLGKGRKGIHLFEEGETGVPIVRTTTAYQLPSQAFANVHWEVVQRVQDQFPSLPLSFNHALIEVYDHRYTKMGYHSDQSLDLAAGSYIALFSCYANPESLAEKDKRKLKVRHKETGEESEFVLENHSVILFSLAANAEYQHKIVLETEGQSPTEGQEWLGITFRQSKTFVFFRGGRPFFPDGEPLVLADEEMRQAFFALKGQENSSQGNFSSVIGYTLSPGDLIQPNV